MSIWYDGKIVRLERDGFGIVQINDKKINDGAEYQSFFSARNVENRHTMEKLSRGTAVRVRVSDRNAVVWPAEVVKLINND